MRLLLLLLLATTAVLLLAAAPASAYKVSVTKEAAEAGKRQYYTATDGHGGEVRWWFNLAPRKKYNSRALDRFEYVKGASFRVTDAQLRARGFSTSEIKTIRYVVLGESGGNCASINSWDGEKFSWGLPQYAGRPGTLNSFLVWLKANERRQFENVFIDSGVDIQKDGTVVLHGKALSYADLNALPEATRAQRYRKGRKIRSKMWQDVRADDRAMATFMLAGRSEEMCLGQLQYWREHFLRPALFQRIKGRRAKELFSSELLVTSMVYLRNWMPSYQKEWMEAYIDEKAVALPAAGQSLTRAQLDAAFEFMNAKRVALERSKYPKTKPGSRPSEVPGSFKSGRVVAQPGSGGGPPRPTSLLAGLGEKEKRERAAVRAKFSPRNAGGTKPGDYLCNEAFGWCEDTRRQLSGTVVNQDDEAPCTKAFPGATSGPKESGNDACGGGSSRVCCAVVMPPPLTPIPAYHMSAEAIEAMSVKQDNTRVVLPTLPLLRLNLEPGEGLLQENKRK